MRGLLFPLLKKSKSGVDDRGHRLRSRSPVTIYPGARARQRHLKIEGGILIRTLSWALSGFGKTFTLEKRLRVQTIDTASNLCNSGLTY